MTSLTPRQTAALAKGEHGGITVLGLFVFVAMLCVGGLAIDTEQLIAARTQLQVAADSVAHTALYNRDSKSAADARTTAMTVANQMMPSTRFGDVIEPTDIKFGRWNAETGRFTVDETSRQAVLVTTSRMNDRGNSVGALLTQFAGHRSYDLAAQSVFTTYRPACFTEGFVAEGIVDIQSNNAYFNGFCIHSNTYVSVNSNNTWEAGTVVSMPNTDDLDLPQSGFKTNLGLQAALREGYYHLRLIRKLPQIIANLATPGNEWERSYITDWIVHTLPSKNIDPSMTQQGKIYKYTCTNPSGKLTLGSGTYKKVIIVTNCSITFGSGAIITDTVLATTNTDTKSVTGPSGVQIGIDDGCATGGGGQVLTLGGVDVAANLAMFGGQIVAAKDVTFSARADGMKGASIISGGEISGTSNMSMAQCGTGMEENFEANYFRLAH